MSKNDDKLNDRIKCKENYINFLLNETKVNASQLDIDKLIKNVFEKEFTLPNNSTLMDLIDNEMYDLALSNRQFNSMVSYINDQLNSIEKDLSDNENNPINFDITNIKCMIDVSGSMEGQPMMVAIGLGLIFMKLQLLKSWDAHQTFLTFDTNPSLVNIEDCNTLPAMVHKIKKSSWGGSTNFLKAFDLIIQESKDDLSKIPSMLIVFSDMQFNSALYNNSDNWDTMYEIICNKFKDITDKIPTIVFWNLRGNPSGTPVKADTNGVIQISGYSASLLKMLLFGAELDKKEKLNPLQTLIKTIESKEYNKIREILGWDNNKLSNSIFKQEIDNL